MNKCNILIGRFQPMTKGGHLKCAEQAMKETGNPTMFLMIETKEQKLDQKHPFPSSMLLPIYKDALKNNKNVAGITLVKNANIIDLAEACRAEGFEPVSWTCGTDRYDSYKKMAERYAAQANLVEDFQVIEIKRGDEDSSATKLREYLRSGNEKAFEKDFIPCHNVRHVFNMLRTQLLSVKETLMERLNRMVLYSPLTIYLNEATFNKVDWAKHDYKYIDAVLDDIIAGKEIRLGKDGTDGFLEFPDEEREDIVAWAQEMRAKPEKDMEEFNDFFNNYSGKSHPWNLIFKGYYSGKEKTISTRDQETATCSVWNWFNGMKADGSPIDPDVDTGDNPKDLYDEGGLTPAGITTLNGALDSGKRFDKGWINTFNLQVEAIVNTLDSFDGVDKTKYVAARVGNKHSKVEIAYTKFLDTYASLMGRLNDTSTQKDSYCTTDIILYNAEKASEIISTLEEATGNITEDTWEEGAQQFRDLVKSNLIIGLSLKKLSKDCIVDKFNYDGPKQITTSVVELEYKGPNGRTINYSLHIKCKGNYGLKYYGEDDNGKPVAKEGLKEMVVVFRSFGDFQMAMEIKASERSISLGKVPIALWTKAYKGVCDYIYKNKKKTGATNFKEIYKEAGIPEEFNPNDRPALQYSKLCAFLGARIFKDPSQVNKLIRAGIKSGTLSLPFVLMH